MHVQGVGAKRRNIYLKGYSGVDIENFSVMVSNDQTKTSVYIAKKGKS